MTPPADFRSDLAYSHSQSAQPWWREVYETAFPNLEAMADVRADGWAQRGGIDRVLTLSSGKTLTVDEKVRRVDYDDILLEYWSDEAKKIPGWVEKELACDFIAYAIEPRGECYLLPFQQLRAAWRRYGQTWCDQYKEVRAQNRRYVTVSVAVPVADVLAGISKAMVVSFRPPGTVRAA